MVKVSVSLKRSDPVRPSIFVLLGTPPPPAPETTQLPTPRGTSLTTPGPGGQEAGQYLAIRGSSSNMVSSTLR